MKLTLHLSRTRTGQFDFALHKVLKNWGEGNSDATATGGNEGAGACATTNDATWVHAVFPGTEWDNEGGDFSPKASAIATVGGNLDVGGSGGAFSEGVYEWGSTLKMVFDVKSWLKDPLANFGWILIGPEDDRSAKRFDSRNTGTDQPQVSFRPQLTVVYIP